MEGKENGLCEMCGYKHGGGFEGNGVPGHCGKYSLPVIDPRHWESTAGAL